MTAAVCCDVMFEWFAYANTRYVVMRGFISTAHIYWLLYNIHCSAVYRPATDVFRVCRSFQTPAFCRRCYKTLQGVYTGNKLTTDSIHSVLFLSTQRFRRVSFTKLPMTLFPVPVFSCYSNCTSSTSLKIQRILLGCVCDFS